jgi:hypothetical protein
MGNHNYPKNLKKRDVSYSKSNKLFQEVGEEKLKELFQQQRMYKSAKILSEQLGQYISPFVVRHTRTRYKLRESDEEINV